MPFCRATSFLCRLAVLLCGLAACAAAAAAAAAGRGRGRRVLTVTNPRPGTADAAVDAHDGPVVRWSPGGPFYRYGMSYTNCTLDRHPTSPVQTFFRRLLNRFVQGVGELVGAGSGFDCGQIVVGALSEGFGRDCGFKSPRHGQTVMVHTSWDLVHWELVTPNALGGADAPSWLADDSIIFRPAVVRNPETGLYVLWANRLPRDEPVVESYRRAGFVVGTSATPEGPFAFAAAEADAMPTMAHAGGADFSLMYDPDTRDAYIAYGAWHNFRIDSAWRPDWMRDGHQIAVQRLDRATFTGPANNARAVTVTAEGHEAPSFFKRGAYYYLTYGELCCFCRRGSDAKVHVARDPLGPYAFVEQLNRRTRPANPHHVPAQNSDVVEVPLASGETEYLWAADLWFSSKSGLKGDDHQYWEPLKFVDRTVAFPDGSVVEHVPVPTRSRPGGEWVDRFTVEVTTAAGAAAAAEAGDTHGDPAPHTHRRDERSAQEIVNEL